MNKLLLSFSALLMCVCVYARDYSIKVDTTSVPSAAKEVLVQRFTQMLEVAGHSAGEDGPEILVTGEVKDRMETPGSMSQIALSIVLKASCGSAKAEFPLTGVGSDYEDAWVRAVKRLLPRSKEAKAFVSSLSF
ncbi:MAG: hypothetical protein IK052_03885 [Bacteroidales bacterium]|nr:hypothetical protein [Bacteroidales bacterium]